MIKPKKYLNIKIEQPDGTVLANRFFMISDYNTEVTKSANFMEDFEWIVTKLQESLKTRDLDFIYGKNSKSRTDLRNNGFNKKWKREIFQKLSNDKKD